MSSQATSTSTTTTPNPPAIKAADVQNLPTGTQSVQMTVYKVYSKLPTDPDNDQSWGLDGYLYQGTKRASALDGTAPGPQVDISSCIVAKPVPGSVTSVELLKTVSPITDWSFDITIANFDDPDGSATFIGTMVKEDGTTWDLRGSQLAVTPQAVKVTVLQPSMTVPNFGDGTSIQSLQNMSPIVTVATPEVKVGEDGAQIYGNQIMQSLMMNSLVDSGVESVLGNIQPITDEEQLKIYNNNLEFFKRAGVHMVCDYLKKNGTEIPSSITNHIEWKNTIFIRMCSQPSPPKGQAGSSSQWDAAKLYGLDPENNPKDRNLVLKLQQQYHRATMDCYGLGFKQQCTDWYLYENHAEAWFNYYAYVCGTSESTGRTATLSSNPPGVTGNNTEGPSSVRQILNKLSLLKHAAIRNAKDNNLPVPKLSIKSVIKKLDAANNENMAYAMYINEQLANEVKALLGPTGDNALSAAMKAELQRTGHEVSEGTRNLAAIAANVFELILNNDSGASGIKSLGQRFLAYWQKRCTRGMRATRMTVAQANEALNGIEIQDLLKPSKTSGSDDVPQLIENSDAATETNQAITGFLSRLGKGFKAVSGKIGFVLKLGMHVGAIVAMSLLIEGKFGSASPAQIGLAICASTMAGLTAIGKLVDVAPALSKSVSVALANSGFYQKLRGYFCLRLAPAFSDPASFSKLATAFVGDLERLVRTLGLIGCIFNIYLSANEMSETAGQNNPIAEQEHVFAEVNLALGCTELALGVGSIVPEVAGFETLAAVCGPLGLVVGLAALGVMLASLVDIPKTDPWSKLEDWMADAPTKYGSYNQSLTIIGDVLITYVIPPIKINKVNIVPSSSSNSCNQSAKGGNQDQPNKNNNNGKSNNNSGNNNQGSSNKPDPGQEPRCVTLAQQTAALRLDNALEAFTTEARRFQANLPVITAAHVYQSRLRSFIVAGLLWDPANFHFQEATNDFVYAWVYMHAHGQWEVTGLNPNTGGNPPNPFIPIVDEMNNAYFALEAAMAEVGTAAVPGSI
ncbi:hypothetical protein FOBRF1_006535 [Fusarium oxysporum]